MSELKHRLYKICVIGDGGVGKTTMLHQYVENKFVENIQMTIGTNFFIKNLLIKEFDASIKLQLWDLGGQERFSIVRPDFYLGAKGIVYLFDLASKTTFENLRNWKIEIEKSLEKIPPSILIGNKLDLVSDGNREIGIEDILYMKQELNVLNYFETSAKAGFNIENAFKESAKCIFNHVHKSEDYIKH